MERNDELRLPAALVRRLAKRAEAEGVPLVTLVDLVLRGYLGKK